MRERRTYKKTRSEQASDAIREMILAGQLPLGKKISETVLAERMQISRTPIRHALAVLQSEGLVEYTSQVGFSVRRITQNEIREIFDVRAALFGLAAQFAAQTLHDRQANGDAAALLSAMDESLAGTQSEHAFVREWLEHRDAFYALIIARNPNKHLSELLIRSRDVPLILVIRRFLAISREMATIERHYFFEILAAIQLGQPDRANYMLIEVIRYIGQRVIARWAEVESLL